MDVHIIDKEWLYLIASCNSYALNPIINCVEVCDNITDNSLVALIGPQNLLIVDGNNNSQDIP